MITGKQMCDAHRKVLRSKLTYLVENIQTEPLIPSLISNNVLCDVTKAYVTAPKTRDQRINRLVDVLMTKEKGLFVFCEILRKSGYQFVAHEIEGKQNNVTTNTITFWGFLRIYSKSYIFSLLSFHDQAMLVKFRLCKSLLRL